METERKVARVRLDKTWSADILTLTFVDYDAEGKRIGATAGVDPITFDRTGASAGNRDQAERHGWEQKLGDAAALSRDTKTGKSASVADKHASVKDLAERLSRVDGDWNAKGGGRKPLTPEQERALLEQLAAKLGVTITG